METARSSDCSEPPAVRSSGWNGNGCRLTPRAVATEGDGARGVSRLGRRSALAIFRGFSRTACLRGPDGIKRVSPVNRRVRESGTRWHAALGGRNRSDGVVQRWPRPLARRPQRAVEPLGRVVQRCSRPLAHRPATEHDPRRCRAGGSETARTSSTEVFETARVTPATDHDPRRRREGG